MSVLLTRDDFREGVFKRDNHKCVVCGEPAVDAHHIMERRLWPDGGYYLDNGVSVCEEHHLDCESTVISTEEIREAAGIEKVLLPPHLYPDMEYDKWANIIVTKDKSLRGEFWYDESVQKALRRRFFGDVGLAFSKCVKYPRTYHLPWSPTPAKDDRMMTSTEGFEGRRVIVTEKMDGENTTMYDDCIHARSIDGRSHPSRDWVKNFWSENVGWQLPVDWRLCGENLYAEHSIPYSELPTYFMGFSIWTRNVAMPWDDTIEWFEMLGVTPVPVLYDGIFDEDKIRNYTKDIDLTTSEGYVIRIADAINMFEWRKYVGKFVRTNHVQTVKHWMHGKPVVPNKLA